MICRTVFLVFCANLLTIYIYIYIYNRSIGKFIHINIRRNYMKNSTKRLLAGFSAAVMCVSAAGTAGAETFTDDLAFEETYEAVSTQDAKSNITWEITDDGVLKVDGTGVIPSNFIVITKGAKEYSAIEIGDGITGISEYAIREIGKIGKKVTLHIPSSVKYISDRAFGNIQISNLALSEGLESIGYYALGNNKLLKEVNIPASVKEIAANPFPNNHITTLNVAAGNKYFVSQDNILYTKDMTRMIVYPGGKLDTSYTLPSALTALDLEGISYNYKLTTIELGSNKNFTLSDGILFSKDKTRLVLCPRGLSLKSYAIPNGVKVIEDYALSGISGLQSLTIPVSVTSIGIEALGYNDFTSLVIPDSVTEIKEYAIRGNDKLTDITLPKGLTYIPDGMFADCCSLKEISLPQSLTYIGEDAFIDTGLESIDIPDSVTFIGDGAFVLCDLKEVKLPASLKEIGSSVFEGHITEITVPGSVEKIGEYCFSGCENLSSITLSEGITKIDSYALADCRVATVNLPKSLKTIEDNAFKGCWMLTIDLPEGLEYIGENAFGGTGFLSIKIPATTKYIGAHAFDSNESLTEVYLPDFYKDNLDKYLGENAIPDYAEIKYYSTASAPAKPAPAAEPTYGGAEVTWEPVDGAINYRVFTFVPGQKIRQFGSDTKGTSMTVKGLKGGERTGIIVLAQYANKKWSSYTEDDIVYVVPNDAIKPYLCVNPKGNGSYYLIWSSVPTSVRYKVMAREKGSDKWELIGATRQRCRITVQLDPGKEYDFLVRGLNAKGKMTPMDLDDIVSG